MNPQPMPRTGYVPVHTPDRPLYVPPPTGTAIKPRNPFVAPITGLPVLMQGHQPSCVAHAIKWAMMQKILKDEGKVVNLSARFLYAISKLSDGIPGQGTSINNALKVAETIGVCEEQYFPDDVSLPYAEYIDASKIPAEAYQNAKLHRIQPAQFLTDLSYSGLTQGIYSHDIVIIGMDIDQSWWTDTSGNITWQANKILPLRAPNPATSRHCIDLYAFNDDIELLALENWWSDEWGEGGSAFMYKDEMSFIYEAAVFDLA